VLKEELMLLLVTVQLVNMITENKTQPVIHVTINAQPVNLPLTIVPNVLKTESEPQIVTVLSMMDSMKLMDKLIAHLVTTHVLPVPLMKPVSLVPQVELIALQPVHVQKVNMKMPTKSVLLVTTNVLPVTITMIVLFVLETESKPQLVSVQKVPSIMVKPNVQFVLTNVIPVLTVLTIV